MWQRMRYELNKQRTFRQVRGDKHANREQGGLCVGGCQERETGEGVN